LNFVTASVNDWEVCCKIIYVVLPAKVLNRVYEEWYTSDQQVLDFSSPREVFAEVAAKEIAAQFWKAIEASYSSRTKACAIYTRLALATAQKGNMPVA
jgi:glutathionylspermidine synthase